MNRILVKKELASDIKLFEIENPAIAERAKAGQFIVLRASETGERIPLTIADSNPAKGIITIIFQEVGKTTKLLGTLSAGDEILDVIGPLGKPTHIDNYGTVVCIGGGIGIAPLYPIAKAMKKAGNHLISIIGARSRHLIIYEQEMREISDRLLITTDDGSYGRHGLVTNELQALIDEGQKIDQVVAIGPSIMMKAVSNTTRPYNIKTMVSLNTIMVDGTGMCGCCRVTVGNKTKFVCVDGPDFDGHLVNFDEMMQRQRTYLAEEKRSLELFAQKHKACDKVHTGRVAS